ncbi:winged helix-turn-helix transcriptional regulator [Fodinicola acaciae]|uniref:winged helix-turn-helix transcriptional regulator n=1 Tax=Fodinicola acaciae TaxID=2681555 RepID=UPI001C9E6026|nr:helix-turn-helix domain-containing protein [Fodinicola acaciae]
MVQQYLAGCPARTGLEVLANKWTVLVTAALRKHGGPMRFNELRRQLVGLTQKVLTQNLRALERDGLVTRTVYPTVPPRVEYELTELGADAAGLLTAVGLWAERHMAEILSSRQAYDERAAKPVEPVRN